MTDHAVPAPAWLLDVDGTGAVLQSPPSTIGPPVNLWRAEATARARVDVEVPVEAFDALADAVEAQRRLRVAVAALRQFRGEEVGADWILGVLTGGPS